MLPDSKPPPPPQSASPRLQRNLTMPTTTNYIWDEQNYLVESDGTNTINVVYTNEPQQYGNLVSTRISSTTSYHHFDAGGSTRQLTTIRGHVTDIIIYDAWGNIITRAGTTLARLLWISELGYYFDLETAQYYVRARIYGPGIGRWTSVDPSSLYNSDRAFVYADNSTLDLVDPSGLEIAGPGNAPFVSREPPPPTCAFLTVSPKPDDLRRWKMEGIKIGKVIPNTCTGKDIGDAIRQNRCCTITIIGHRGGPDNPGGIVTQCGAKQLALLPNPAVEAQIAAAFKSIGCASCDIRILACGANDPRTLPTLQGIAARTGCLAGAPTNIGWIGDRDSFVPTLGEQQI